MPVPGYIAQTSEHLEYMSGVMLGWKSLQTQVTPGTKSNQTYKREETTWKSLNCILKKVVKWEDQGKRGKDICTEGGKGILYL